MSLTPSRFVDLPRYIRGFIVGLPPLPAREVGRLCGLSEARVETILRTNPNLFSAVNEELEYWSAVESGLDTTAGPDEGTARSLLEQVVPILSDELCGPWYEFNLKKPVRKEVLKVAEAHDWATLEDLISHFSESDSQLCREIVVDLSVSRRNNTYFDVMSLVRASLEGDWRLHPQAQSMHNLRTSQRQRLERQLDVVALRGAGMTLQEVGDRCGVTRERARQLLEDFAHLIKVDKASRRGAEKAQLVERARLVFQSTPGISRDDLVREVGASWTQIRQSIPRRWLKFISFDDFDPRFQWSKDQILESLRRGAQIESPLSQKTFDILVKEGVIDCCTTVRISQIFGKWSTACELAGVESVASWISEYERNWTEEDCLDWLCRFLVTQDHRRSIDAYAQWIVSQPGNPPSSGTIRGMIGPWSDSINEALPRFRSGRYADLYRVSLEADCAGQVPRASCL